MTEDYATPVATEMTEDYATPVATEMMAVATESVAVVQEKLDREKEGSLVLGVHRIPPVPAQRASKRGAKRKSSQDLPSLISKQRSVFEQKEVEPPNKVLQLRRVSSSDESMEDTDI